MAIRRQRDDHLVNRMRQHDCRGITRFAKPRDAVNLVAWSDVVRGEPHDRKPRPRAGNHERRHLARGCTPADDQHATAVTAGRQPCHRQASDQAHIHKQDEVKGDEVREQ